MITREDIDNLSEADQRRVLGYIMSNIGRKGRNRPINPETSLAAMAVGESRLFHWKRSSQMHARRITARRQLNDPDADWMCRMTNQGIRVVRIK